MRIAGLVFAAALVSAVLASTSACTSEGTPCYRGDYRACDCSSGGHGYQQCSADGQGYGACDCSGKIPGVPDTDAAVAEAGADATAADSGLLPFLALCDTNEECATGLCFTFPSRGKYCTKHCTQAAECPAPSPGCNNQGVCKAP